MSGWFAVKRGIHDHPIFHKRPDRLYVWTWMLATAAWKPQRFVVKGKGIRLERGQLCVSQRQIEDETGMGRQALRSFLALLEAEHVINQKPAHGITQSRTIITICNYEQYQGGGSRSNPADNPETTQNQPTNKQENNSNNTPSEEAAASAPIEVSVLSSAVWAAGKQYLASKGVQNAGAMIGRWLKSHPPLALLEAIGAAQKAGTEDPVPYITETLKGEPRRGKSSKQSDRLSAFVAGARGAP